MKTILILFSLILSITIIGCSGQDKEVALEEEKAPVVEQVEDEDPEEDIWSDLKGEIIGKSDKDFKAATKAKPSKVRNDSTGNWKKTVTSEPIPIEEYALSYSNEYMEEKEIHFIINFNYNTTTKISKDAGLVFITIQEYQDKEEHDAKKLGSGMILGQYIIYPDGDIEEIKE